MKPHITLISRLCALAAVLFLGPARSYALMAGSASGSPADAPGSEARVDSEDVFSGVGAVTTSGAGKGTCTAISSHWVLTAAHVVNGVSSVTLYFNVGGATFTYTSSNIYTYNYLGKSYNPSTHDYDVALIYIPEGLDALIETYAPYDGAWTVTSASANGTRLELVGYGGSGYGNVGYSSSYPLTQTVRRVGANVVDSLGHLPDTECVFYLMDFDDDSSAGTVGGSLGNDVETTFTVGDSGGPAFVKVGDEYYLAGVNTLVSYEGSVMGKYGTYALGIAIPSVSDWIGHTLTTVPEPSQVAFLVAAAALLPVLWRKRRLS